MRPMLIAALLLLAREVHAVPQACNFSPYAVQHPADGRTDVPLNAQVVTVAAYPCLFPQASILLKDGVPVEVTTGTWQETINSSRAAAWARPVTPLQPNTAYVLSFEDSSGALTNTTFTTGTAEVDAGQIPAPDMVVQEYGCHENLALYFRCTGRARLRVPPGMEGRAGFFHIRARTPTGDKLMEILAVEEAGSDVDFTGLHADNVEPACMDAAFVDETGNVSEPAAETCLQPCLLDADGGRRPASACVLTGAPDAGAPAAPAGEGGAAGPDMASGCSQSTPGVDVLLLLAVGFATRRRRAPRPGITPANH